MLHTSPEKQRGLSPLGIVIGLAAIGFLLTIALKIIPVYMSNMAIQSAMKGLGETSNLTSLTSEEAVSRMKREFDVNNIGPPASKSLKVVRRTEGWLLNIDYEVRVNFMGNLDVVMNFKNQLNSADPSSCCKKLIADVKEEQ